MMKSIINHYMLQIYIIMFITLVLAADSISPISLSQTDVHPYATVHNTAAQNPAADDVTYHQGDVLVGLINVYLIFWEPTGNVSPRYNQIIEDFFKVVGNTPLYHSLSQYHDAAGRSPTGSQLASSWIDRRPFPKIPVPGAAIEDEVRHAESVKGWSGNLHNFFLVFDEKVQEDIPDACAYHGFFGSGETKTVYARIPNPASLQGCAFPPEYKSPNHDHDADSAINVASHEFLEAVASPSAAGWYAGQAAEIADKCVSNYGYITADGSNVNWNGHRFIIQGEWSNYLHGCTLNGTDKILYYVLTNRNSGKVLTVENLSPKDGTPMLQWDNTPPNNPQWVFANVKGSEYFKIAFRNGGGLLSVPNKSTSNGTPLLQKDDVGTSDQQWKVVQVSDNSEYVKIVNCWNHKVLSIQNQSLDRGALTIQEDDSGLPSQQWLLTSSASLLEADSHSHE
jgi:hypothetical protein